MRPGAQISAEVTTHTGKPLTLADLRDFLGRCDQAGLPDSAEPLVRVFFSGRAKRLTAKGTPASGRRGTGTGEGLTKLAPAAGIQLHMRCTHGETLGVHCAIPWYNP